MYLRSVVVAVAVIGCSTSPAGHDKPGDARGDQSSSDAIRPDAVRIADARASDAARDARAIDAPRDARAIDAPRDARAIDARPIDARPIDAPRDARAIDAPRDARVIDARPIDARAIDGPIDAPIDARRLDAGVRLDASGTPNTISCYSEGDPTQSCTLPTHCCFSDYSSQHDGRCSDNTCLYGTISCDGPEDCATGQRCCSHALFDNQGIVTGYSLACQTAACGAAPANYELCHIGGAACSNGGTCLTAYLHDNDLPRTLDICQ